MNEGRLAENDERESSFIRLLNQSVYVSISKRKDHKTQDLTNKLSFGFLGC